jgi:hypothetical protein
MKKPGATFFHFLNAVPLLEIHPGWGLPT